LKNKKALGFWSRNNIEHSTELPPVHAAVSSETLRVVEIDEEA
jgi:hypothetical protein